MVARVIGWRKASCEGLDDSLDYGLLVGSHDMDYESLSIYME
jgi:hypothetical protein